MVINEIVIVDYVVLSSCAGGSGLFLLVWFGIVDRPWEKLATACGMLIFGYSKFRQFDTKVQRYKYNVLVRLCAVVELCWNETIGKFWTWVKLTCNRLNGNRQQEYFSQKVPYKYSKLTGDRHIRLLNIKKRYPFGLIECEMFTTSLDKAPEYEAISYTWGDPTKTHGIIINESRFQTTAARIESCTNEVLTSRQD